MLFHELVGLHLRVHRSPSKDIVGLEGRVVDETMNTIVVDTGAGTRRTVLKHKQAFIFTTPEGVHLLVPGTLLLGRPWDRLKNIGKRQYKQATK